MRVINEELKQEQQQQQKIEEEASFIVKSIINWEATNNEKKICWS